MNNNLENNNNYVNNQTNPTPQPVQPTPNNNLGNNNNYVNNQTNPTPQPVQPTPNNNLGNNNNYVNNQTNPNPQPVQPTPNNNLENNNNYVNNQTNPNPQPVQPTPNNNLENNNNYVNNQTNPNPQPVQPTPNNNLENNNNYVNNQTNPNPQPVQPTPNNNLGNNNNYVNNQTNPNPQPVQPTLNNNLNQEVKDDKPNKKGKKLPLIIGLIVIILAVVAGLVYYKVSSNPKNVFIKGINKASTNFKQVSEKFINPKTNIIGSVTTTGSMNFNMNFNIENLVYNDPETSAMISTLIDKLNMIKIDYNYQKDVDNNKILLNLNTYMTEKKLLQLKLFSDNQKQYIFLQDLYDKYIEISMLNNLEDNDVEQMVEDIMFLFETVGKSIIDNIKDSYITTEKTTIVLNNKDTKVNKSILNLNAANQKEISKAVISDLKNNEKIIEIDKKYNFGIQELTVEEIEDEVYDDFTLTVYYSKLTNNIVKLDLISPTDNQSISYTIGNESILESITNGKSDFKLTFKNQDNKFNITLKIEDVTVASIEGETVNDNYTYKFSLNIEEITISGEGSIKIEILKDNEEYNATADFTIEVKQQGENLGKINIKANEKTTKGANVNENITNAIHYENITEEDMEEIANNIYSILFDILSD